MTYNTNITHYTYSMLMIFTVLTLLTMLTMLKVLTIIIILTIFTIVTYSQLTLNENSLAHNLVNLHDLLLQQWCGEWKSYYLSVKGNIHRSKRRWLQMKRESLNHVERSQVSQKKKKTLKEWTFARISVARTDWREFLPNIHYLYGFFFFFFLFLPSNEFIQIMMYENKDSPSCLLL